MPALEAPWFVPDRETSRELRLLAGPIVGSEVDEDAVVVALCAHCSSFILSLDGGTWALVDVTWTQRAGAPDRTDLRVTRFARFSGLWGAMASHPAEVPQRT